MYTKRMIKTISVLDKVAKYHTNDPYSKHIVGIQYEYEHLSRLCKFIRPNDVVYDIGAAFGLYTIPFGLFAQQVFGFEPYPLHAEFLRANIELNSLSNTQVIESAVSNTTKPLTLFFQGRCPSLIKNRHSKSTEVPSLILDDFVKSHPAPNLIKMDIEGGEYFALEGMQELLSQKQPHLLQIEFHPWNMPDDWEKKFKHYLRQYRKVFEIRRENEHMTLWK